MDVCCEMSFLRTNRFCSVSSDISITRKKKRDKRLTTGGLDDVIEESVGSVSAREEVGGGENAFGGEVCEVSERSPLCVPFSFLTVCSVVIGFVPPSCLPTSSPPAAPAPATSATTTTSVPPGSPPASSLNSS